jgi:ribA/ribD-fused uncharacterized protein
MKEVSESANFAVTKAEEAMAKTKTLEKTVGELRQENVCLKKIVSNLQSKTVMLECQSRRENLIFSGIQESDDETGKDSWRVCEEKLLNILQKANLGHVKFERVHRLGTKDKTNKQPRRVIAKFSCFKDREAVWFSRFSISQMSNVWINEDFPEEIKTKRQTLMPALKAAQRSTDIKHATLKVDKLIIDGRAFTVETMHNSSRFLQPDMTCVIESADTVVFFTRHSVFSNLHPMPIQLDGTTFSCNEQYYQYMKALHFNDLVTAERIKRETDPYTMMSLAREIKSYRHSEWLKHARSTLLQANTAKYRQHQSAKEALMATASKKIGEASTNSIFGTGIGLWSKFASDSSKWTGQNIMGSILTEIRSMIV